MARLWALASTLLCLLACDPTVIVGYAPPRTKARDAAVARKDAAVSGDTGLASIDASPAMRTDTGADGALDTGVGRDAERDAALPEVNWISGAHAGNTVQEYVDFGTWRGRPLDVAHVFPDRTQGWPGIVNPSWPVDMFNGFTGKLLISVPLYPEGQGNNKDCASGAYDSEWRKLGTFLADRGRPDSIIRLGWGPNDLSHPWHADADPSDWIGCFRRAAAAIRATDARVRIDWSFNELGASYVASGDPYADYPGDAYVDFVGLEAYDRFPPATSDATWDAQCNKASGLCTLIAFARAHGKRVGIAEWGIASCGEDPGGDNPFFIHKMFETFAANADVLAYEAYFLADDTDVCSTLLNGTNPRSAVEYQALYGPR
jgi:hypothetical protein